ncbi:thiosulfate sulfurtransferase 18-like isoform X1 [Triticum dicoccoides]|uniref:thiosulfate sulfurtransferase 18-like isoform X1 n=1 Tax=Triticum dicoccoides TaxID=85692 RepID=UPI000E7C269F|nr:thiosulfate sulfurtransferase 18-like isoform X1 [Triticum dicoccoides]
MAPPPHENEMTRSESAPATAVKTVDVQTAATPAVGVTPVDVQTAATPAVGVTTVDVQTVTPPAVGVTTVDVQTAAIPAMAVTTVDVQTAARELQEQQDGMMYLDVRTEEEMGKGHIGGSLNVPYFFVTPQGTREKNPRFVEQVASLYTTEQHILVGCQSGKRSELACVDLLAAGFMNVKNVGGGYAAWLHNGLPVTVAVPTPPPTPESAAAI